MPMLKIALENTTVLLKSNNKMPDGIKELRKGLSSGIILTCVQSLTLAFNGCVTSGNV